MKKDRKQINRHATMYIDGVFKESLTAAGFTSIDDRLLNWYRLQNNQIMNTISFVSSWSTTPLMLSIRYGIYPLFDMPIYVSDVCQPSNFMLEQDERFINQAIVENSPCNSTNYICYSDDILVMAPKDESRGRYTLDGILLPCMDQIHTIEEAYHFHKKRRLQLPLIDKSSPSSKYRQLSRIFIDMALWAQDEEMYSLAADRSCEASKLYQELNSKFPKNLEYKKELELWKIIHRVFTSGDCESYIKRLAENMTHNRRLLAEQYGIALE